ncbi:MAG: zf-HC2 domain-containing protein [Immundisolibacter sp.]|uniref:anti-sigma factor family protein n=1 Tax=Immundisolibacter sp. TaxID=1934948 RepID=UPI003D0F75DE
MLNCRESTALMSEARERDLTLAERLGLRLHWAMCSACRRFDRQLDVLRAAARRYAARDDRITSDQDDAPPR